MTAPVADRPAARTPSTTLRIALAGAPNCGKTSLFNALSGGKGHVGNYPGVTVEQRTAELEIGGKRVQLTDLPGAYSLSGYSPEERITGDALLADDGYDAVVIVLDSTLLERGLALTGRLLGLGTHLVLCLNMSDEAHAAGQRLDRAALESLLGIPVVRTVGHRGEGIDDLRAALLTALDGPVPSPARLSEPVGSVMESLVAALQQAGVSPGRANHLAGELLSGQCLPGRGTTPVHPPVPEPAALRQTPRRGPPSGLASGQCLPGRGTTPFHSPVPEPAALRQTPRRGPPSGLVSGLDDDGIPPAVRELAESARAELEAMEPAKDGALWVAEAWLRFARATMAATVSQRARPNARERSDRIDRALAHPVWGLPFFALAMYAVFWATFTLGEAPMDWIEAGFTALGGQVSAAFGPAADESILRSLLVDGIIGGVGGVLVFLPNILLLFLALAVLEDTGYMARAAFVMDRVLNRFGLHGKSFLPMMSGFGCSIPGIMATRTLENERDRLTTMLVLPLMSCGARLPIWMLLVPAFFAPSLRAPVLFGIYVTGVLLALILALTLRRTLFRGEDAPFMLELPPYRLPTLKNVWSKVSERCWLYVAKAGTIILAISIVMWALSAFPKVDDYRVDAEVAAGLELTPDELENRRAAEAMERSFAGRLGRFIEPVLAPLGFDWKLGTAMLGAFAAKEVFVAQVAVVYSMGSADEEDAGLRDRLNADYSPLVGLSLILFLLIGTPCMATVAVTRRESGSWRWAMFQLFGLTGIAYVVSLLTYQLGSLVV